MSPLPRWIGLGALGLLLVHALPVLAQTQDVEFAETLVRARYFEGLPYSRARLLKPAGVERLLEMLRDPAEAELHDNIVMALGMSGAPQAYPALIQFHSSAHPGEVDGAEYRARRAVPLAMGHLARGDLRALQFLIGAAGAVASEPAPAWRHRHLGGKRLQRILRRAAIAGLGMSGRSEALEVLEELDRSVELETARREELRTHIRASRQLSERVRQQGPDRVFGGSPRR